MAVSRFNSGFLWFGWMMQPRSCMLLSSVLSGHTSLYFSPFSTWTYSKMQSNKGLSQLARASSLAASQQLLTIAQLMQYTYNQGIAWLPLKSKFPDPMASRFLSYADLAVADIPGGSRKFCFNTRL